MLGQSSGLVVKILLDSDADYFTNGDILAGKMVVENNKSFNVQNIEIKMRCEEFAYVWVPNGQGGYYETEISRCLSLRNTLFPLRSVRYHPEADPHAKYTLQAGVHEFPFQFNIPIADRYPQTLTIKGSGSGIKWYLKGVVHRGQVLASTKRVFKEFEMRPSTPLPLEGPLAVTEPTTTQILAFLPGYGAWLKTPSGKLKDLIPGTSRLRKKVDVQMTLAVPRSGLLQYPHPINVFLNVECPDSELLMIRQVEFQLKQKVIVSVNEGWNTSIHRENFNVLTLRSLDWGLKEGLDKLEDILKDTQITGRLPSSISKQHFDVSYKLVLVVALASREKPTAMERVRMSVPIHLNSFIPSSRVQLSAHDELPTYQQLPGAGESIVPADGSKAGGETLTMVRPSELENAEPSSSQRHSDDSSRWDHSVYRYDLQGPTDAPEYQASLDARDNLPAGRFSPEAQIAIGGGLR